MSLPGKFSIGPQFLQKKVFWAFAYGKRPTRIVGRKE
jgi:hypothetical protein